MAFLYERLLEKTAEEPWIMDVDRSRIEETAAILAGAGRVFVAGMGRSGLVARAVACRLTHAGIVAHVVGDATTPACGGGDVLWIFSRTGSSAALRSHAERAADAGALVSVVTADPGSALAKAAAHVMTLGSGAGGDVPPLLAGTLFEYEALRTGDLAAARAGMILGRDIGDMLARHANLE